MKHKKLLLVLSVVLMFAVFAISAFAADSELLAESEALTEPTTNFYYIIEGCWEYIFPAEVIADNQNIITFFTMIMTVFFLFIPFIVLFSCFRRKK